MCQSVIKISKYFLLWQNAAQEYYAALYLQYWLHCQKVLEVLVFSCTLCKTKSQTWNVVNRTVHFGLLVHELYLNYILQNETSISRYNWCCKISSFHLQYVFGSMKCSVKQISLVSICDSFQLQFNGTRWTVSPFLQ